MRPNRCSAAHRVTVLGFVLMLVGGLTGLPSSVLAATIAPKQWVTKSGIVVLFVERHTLPTVHLQLRLSTGSVHDPEGKEGTANLVSSLLDEGTTNRTSQEIAEAIDFIGAGLSTSAGPEFSQITMSVLKKDLAVGMELFSDVLINPTFPEEELVRIRQRILGNLVAEQDEPGVVASKAWQELIYGAHPYHHPTEGYPESLPAITRNGLIEFYQRYYQPRNAILAVVGDLSRVDVERLISRYLGPWKNNQFQSPKELSAPAAAPPTVKLIDKELTQANILMGHLGVPRSHPDYYAVSVMNYILGGGGFSSRLLTRIRDNQGLAYSVYSRFSAMKAGGSFYVRLQTKNASANRAIDEVVAIISELQREGVTAQELDDAKAYLVGSFPLRIDTNAKLVGLLAGIEFHNLGLDYFDDYPELIKAVTLKDVKRVASQYLHPDRMVLVVVAKQADAQIQQTEHLP